MARAAVAAGADGLLIEVHPDPDHALSDGAQSLTPAQFTELMAELADDRPGGRPPLRRRPPRSGLEGRLVVKATRVSPLNPTAPTAV